MFYCVNCANEHDYPQHDRDFMSYGPCEVCATVGVCFDVPSKHIGAMQDGRITKEGLEAFLNECAASVKARYPEEFKP